MGVTADLPQSDEQLVLLTRTGDREAFSRLVCRYERAVIAIAMSRVRCWHDAREVAQDALVAAYQMIHRLSSPRKFGPWLLSIAHRQSLLHLRRQNSLVRKTVSLPAEAAAPLPAGESLDLMALLARLPEQECVVVSLRHIRDMSVAEIAHVTARPIGTVTKQLSRAYARLRGWLNGEVTHD